MPKTLQLINRIMLACGSEVYDRRGGFSEEMPLKNGMHALTNKCTSNAAAPSGTTDGGMGIDTRSPSPTGQGKFNSSRARAGFIVFDHEGVLGSEGYP